MSSLECRKEGDVFVVTMKDGATANTFTADVIQEHEAILSEIETSSGNAAVILTSDDPKFWCNGINLEWLLAQGSDYIQEFKVILDKMLLRWALLPVPTLACITGHAFGGGAILACAFDFRVMRSDRGFFCFPEVDIDIPFTESMHEIISNLPSAALNALALTGRRIGGEEAMHMGVVAGSYNEAELFPKTLEMAESLAKKNRATYRSIKYGLRSRLKAFQ